MSPLAAGKVKQRGEELQGFIAIGRAEEGEQQAAFVFAGKGHQPPRFAPQRWHQPVAAQRFAGEEGVVAGEVDAGMDAGQWQDGRIIRRGRCCRGAVFSRSADGAGGVARNAASSARGSQSL